MIRCPAIRRHHYSRRPCAAPSPTAIATQLPAGSAVRTINVSAVAGRPIARSASEPRDHPTAQQKRVTDHANRTAYAICTGSGRDLSATGLPARCGRSAWPETTRYRDGNRPKVQLLNFDGPPHPQGRFIQQHSADLALCGAQCPKRSAALGENLPSR